MSVSIYRSVTDRTKLQPIVQSAFSSTIAEIVPRCVRVKFERNEQYMRK